MEQPTATLDRAGRILIPAEIRRELGLTEGRRLIVRVNKGTVELYTLEEAVRRAQEYCRSFKRPGESVVDQLLEQRRHEVAKELAE